jgi:hypothetical protein
MKAYYTYHEGKQEKKIDDEGCFFFFHPLLPYAHINKTKWQYPYSGRVVYTNPSQQTTSIKKKKKKTFCDIKKASRNCFKIAVFHSSNYCDDEERIEILQNGEIDIKYVVVSANSREQRRKTKKHTFAALHQEVVEDIQCSMVLASYHQYAELMEYPL